MSTKPAKHLFSAVVRMKPGAPVVESGSGMFGAKEPPKGRPIETWNIIPQADGTVNLTFWAIDGAEAVGLVSKLMQRQARGKPDPRRPNKRLRIGKDDYVVVDVVHPGTKSYDLPTGENPDMKPKKRGKDQTLEFSFA